MSAFFRGLSLFATASAFFLLAIAIDGRRVADSERAQVLIVAALIALGSNAALWVSLGFHDAAR